MASLNNAPTEGHGRKNFVHMLSALAAHGVEPQQVGLSREVFNLSTSQAIKFFNGHMRDCLRGIIDSEAAQRSIRDGVVELENVPQLTVENVIQSIVDRVVSAYSRGMLAPTVDAPASLPAMVSQCA